MKEILIEFINEPFLLIGMCIILGMGICVIIMCYKEKAKYKFDITYLDLPIGYKYEEDGKQIVVIKGSYCPECTYYGRCSITTYGICSPLCRKDKTGVIFKEIKYKTN